MHNSLLRLTVILILRSDLRLKVVWHIDCTCTGKPLMFHPPDQKEKGTEQVNLFMEKEKNVFRRATRLEIRRQQDSSP